MGVCGSLRVCCIAAFRASRGGAQVLALVLHVGVQLSRECQVPKPIVGLLSLILLLSSLPCLLPTEARAFWLESGPAIHQGLFRSPEGLPEPEPSSRGVAASALALPDASEDDWGRCGRQVALAEELLGLPPRLLLSIAKAESGRVTPDRQAVSAWPWTVMAEGRGRYLPSREAAIAEVRELQSRGVRNIDVGCMQINLRYHPDAFDSLHQAFEPAFNVAYGATFLSDLYERLGSWTAAVGRYHSATPEFSTRYRARVLELWERERRRDERQLAERPREPLVEPQPGPAAASRVESAEAAEPDPLAATAPRAAAPAGPGAIGWR